MNVHWNAEATPPIRPARISWSDIQKKFTKIFTDKLEQNGLIYRNDRARFVSECLVVNRVAEPKDLNLKKANLATQTIHIPLPTTEEVQLYLLKLYISSF